MRAQDIHDISDFNYGANSRVLKAAESISEDQFISSGSFPFRGLRGTLVHISDSEYGWRMIIQNGEVM
jgi:uncharacterized damage-inducible protein DinB